LVRARSVVNIHLTRAPAALRLRSLKHGLDRRPPLRPAIQGELLPDHSNIRGPRYYH
jgi:hypothetical protein